MKQTLLATAILLLMVVPTAQGPRTIVTEERAKFGARLEGQQFLLLSRIVARLNAEAPGGPYGLLQKTTGNNCNGFSCDIVCVGNGSAQQQFDVLIGEEADATPTWNGPLPEIIVRPCIVPVATPLPKPVPPPSCEACEAVKDTLKAQLAESTSALEIAERYTATLQREIDLARGQLLAADAEIARLKQQPEPRCTASIWGIKVKCQIVRD